MNITSRIAGQVLEVDASRSVGAPVDLGTGKVVPVSFVAHAFWGAGRGGRHETEGSGTGAGSAVVWPMGAYVSGPHGVRFSGNPLFWGVVATPLVLASGVAAALVVLASRK